MLEIEILLWNRSDLSVSDYSEEYTDYVDNYSPSY